jgi:hypothetical protein
VTSETITLGEILGEAVKPSIMYGNNMGAIFLARNLAAGQWMKHIGIHMRFITDLLEQNQIKVEHIPSEENLADAASKNCKEASHVNHVHNIYNGTFHPAIGESVR